MTIARDIHTNAVRGQVVLPLESGYRGSVPGWLTLLTKEGYVRVTASSVRLEDVSDG